MGGIITGLLVWSLTRSDPGPVARFVIGTDPLYSAPNSADVAISPDGQHIAYLTGLVQAHQIQVRALDQLAPTMLVAEGQPFSPFFSPDGEWLGFYDLADHVLKKSVRAWWPDVGNLAISGFPNEQTALRGLCHSGFGISHRVRNWLGMCAGMSRSPTVK